MSAIKDGGPAFPRDGVSYTDGEGRVRDPYDGHGWMLDPQSGMTLRDYFAAKAMQGWISTYGPSDQHPADRGSCGVVAEQAYALADAMIQAREAQS